MNVFTIKDLENLSGIKAHTIRIWEQRYSLLKPGRTDTNIRFYNNDDLKKLLNIALLNKYGHKISRIHKMSDEEIAKKIFSLPQMQAQQERIGHELIQQMAELNSEKFESILNNYVSDQGIEKTITNIILPFLEKTGILWLTSRINPAQEHLVTNIIRQKIIAAIEKAESYLSKNKMALLLLPEDEHHEIGLLVVYYLLKCRGVKVLYLGANVPVKDAAYVLQNKQPDFFYMHLTTNGSRLALEKYLLSLQSKAPKIPGVVSGSITLNYKRKIPSNITFKKTLNEVLEFISAV